MSRTNKLDDFVKMVFYHSGERKKTKKANIFIHRRTIHTATKNVHRKTYTKIDLYTELTQGISLSVCLSHTQLTTLQKSMTNIVPAAVFLFKKKKDHLDVFRRVRKTRRPSHSRKSQSSLWFFRKPRPLYFAWEAFNTLAHVATIRGFAKKRYICYR